MRRVFVDFEASSLGRRGFPVQVGWVFEDGEVEEHLIAPAPGWEEWSDEAEAIHGFSRERLLRDGAAHDVVARRMLTALGGHRLHASAPSWDGKWLSLLLRAAGLPRHALRLSDTEDARIEAIAAALEAGGVPTEARGALAESVVAAARDAADGLDAPAHRALADARRELDLFLDCRRRAEDAAVCWQAGQGAG